ncbi:hypothetical protein GCM10010174_13990 [Kutzneria viridogrisea]|uniref:Tetratricopeptide (TPR) repeat protein n=1 Tax=Kutzneria viridogrisea TaxID=47990 RepID=A0ABR6BH91_9PSEU|nr:tetratricopeptide (TPR) repeat protein [Kutzneria viridogrisea]
MNLAGPNGWRATREWKDISTKWRLVPDGLRSSRPEDPFARGWVALEAGELGQAEDLFREAVRQRGDGNDYVALGDVFVARRDWSGAADQFERALLVAPLSVLAILGLAMVRAATGAADTAIAELEVLARTRPGDPVVGYYLALALIARTVEVRTEGRGGQLVISTQYQLDTCDWLAGRVLASGTEDAQLIAAAKALQAEVRQGRELVWSEQRPTLVLAGLVLLLGVVPVLLGGLLASVPLLVAGLVLGTGLVFWLFYRYRQPAWQVALGAIAGRA